MPLEFPDNMDIIGLIVYFINSDRTLVPQTYNELSTGVVANAMASRIS